MKEWKEYFVKITITKIFTALALSIVCLCAFLGLISLIILARTLGLASLVIAAITSLIAFVYTIVQFCRGMLGYAQFHFRD